MRSCSKTKRGSGGLKGVFGFLCQPSIARTTEPGPPWLSADMHEVDVLLLVLTQPGCIIALFGCLVVCEHLKCICKWILVGYMQHKSGYLILMLVMLPHTDTVDKALVIYVYNNLIIKMLMKVA